MIIFHLTVHNVDIYKCHKLLTHAETDGATENIKV